ncbi:unnamed protein product, partial [Penicillium nalgiovense]
NDTATTEIYTRTYTLSLHDALPIRFSRHSVEGAQGSHGTRWRERERIGADVLFYLSMLRYPASANYAALVKPAFHHRARSQQAYSTFTV